MTNFVPKLAVRTQPPSSPLSLPLVVKSQFAVCANDPNLRSTLFTGCQYGNIGSRNLCLNSTIPFFSTSVKHIQRVVARHLGTQRSLCMVKSLKFSSLKVFSENSTLIRVIFGNIQSKEIIGTVSDIRSISSGFATIVFSRFLRSENLFALAKQALEAFFFFVCYISYPRVTYRDDLWVTVTQINPRGRVDGTSDDDEPLQPESTSNAEAVEDLENVQLVENLTVFGHDAVVHLEPEAEVGEFDEGSEDSD
uniref:Uncharacterized protein n=1 Tax=Brassica oleracea var. oleracea TaxID=109376 RepID=A0A0D3E2W6_BRAOL